MAVRNNLEFEAWFVAPRESNRSWEIDESTWQFRHRYLPGVGSNEGRFVLATPLFSGPPPHLVISLHAAPSFVLGRLMSKARRIRHAFYIEVTFDSWIKRRLWKETLKRRLISGVDGVVAAGRDAAAYAQRYGAKADRTFEVPNCTDVEFFASGSQMTEVARDALRRQIGLEGVTFIYVGRLWAGKGLVYLLDAFQALQAKSPKPASLMIVGDGPQETELRRHCQTQAIHGVHFMGFRQLAELPSLYRLADVFAFPTLGDPWGMVVEEAMACGLPVVTTSAAGEIHDRVTPGLNGLIVPPAATQPLLGAMQLLANDADLRSRMGRAARRSVAAKTPQRWAEGLEQAVDGLLSLPRKH